jgi:hypothetical protein
MMVPLRDSSVPSAPLDSYGRCGKKAEAVMSVPKKRVMVPRRPSG